MMITCPRETTIASKLSTIFRLSTISRQPIRLLDALYDSRRSLATDPRDKIFALLGLAFDSSVFLPLPSYFLSLKEIYQEMAETLISTTRSLDIICLQGSKLDKDHGMPS